MNNRTPEWGEYRHFLQSIADGEAALYLTGFLGRKTYSVARSPSQYRSILQPVAALILVGWAWLLAKLVGALASIGFLIWVGPSPTSLLAVAGAFALVLAGPPWKKSKQRATAAVMELVQKDRDFLEFGIETELYTFNAGGFKYEAGRTSPGFLLYFARIEFVRDEVLALGPEYYDLLDQGTRSEEANLEAAERFYQRAFKHFQEKVKSLQGPPEHWEHLIYWTDHWNGLPSVQGALQEIFIQDFSPQGFDMGGGYLYCLRALAEQCRNEDRLSEASSFARRRKQVKAFFARLQSY